MSCTALIPFHSAGNPRRQRASGSHGEIKMASAEERLMEWLRDAHAAEEQAETMLRGMAGRIENYPDLRARIEQHIGETQRQAKLVRGCIERRGGSTSTIKDSAGKMLGFGQAMSGMFVGDEETARVCEQILQEEEAMADWLKQNIQTLAQQYLMREETPGATATH